MKVIYSSKEVQMFTKVSIDCMLKAQEVLGKNLITDDILVELNNISSINSLKEMADENGVVDLYNGMTCVIDDNDNIEMTIGEEMLQIYCDMMKDVTETFAAPLFKFYSEVKASEKFFQRIGKLLQNKFIKFESINELKDRFDEFSERATERLSSLF